MEERANIRGALLMVMAMFGFVVNDGFIRVVLEGLPFFQTLFLRGIMLVVLLAVIAGAMGHLRARIRREDRLWVALRSIGELGAAFFFLTALTLMPFPTVSAVMQVTPLAVTLAAALFLAQPIGWRRLVAIAVGFGGVMLIIKPGTAAFEPAALLVLAAVASVTLRDVVTRKMDPDLPSSLVALITALVVTLGSGIAALTETWRVPSPLDLTLLVGSTGFLGLAFVGSVAAMRHGEIAFVSPFRYTALLFALIIGALVFGEFPDGWALLGAAIVVAMGLYTIWREARHGASHKATANP